MTYLFLSVYFLSAFFMWIHVKLSYSKGGVFYGLNPTISELVYTIVPILNSTACIVFWLFCFPVELNVNLNKLFNIK